MYKVAGVSKFKGSYKVRFANDLTRVKLLSKAGNTDIELIELPRAMNKPAIVTYLKTTEFYKNPQMAAAIDAADEKYNAPKAVKNKKGGKGTVKAKAKPSLDAIKARGTKKVAQPEAAAEPVVAQTAEPTVEA